MNGKYKKEIESIVLDMQKRINTLQDAIMVLADNGKSNNMAYGRLLEIFRQIDSEENKEKK